MPPVQSRAPEQVQRRTFYMIGCERCGQFGPPSARLEGAARTEPMRCPECLDFLMLVECFIAPESEAYQERGPGDTIRYVSWPDRLPLSDGRQVWMQQEARRV